MEDLNIFSDIFGHFWDPGKRIFIGYLGLSILIAFAWLILIKRNSIYSAIKLIFNPKILFSDSSKADAKIFIFNRIFTLFVSPLLISQIVIATTIYYALHRIDFISSGQFSDVNKALVVTLFSFSLFIIDDFTKYLLHRWMHRYPILWALHKVHHSATTLTPITVYRIHPLEGVLYALRGTIAQGSAISVFTFFFGNSVDLYTIVGVNILVFFFHVTGSNLRHSHIHISYPRWLEYILISPAQHQLHHSIAEEHYDKNFGVALAVWDWAFGSLHHSEEEKELTFGLDKTQVASSTSLRQIYIGPFVDMSKVIKRRWKKLRQNF